MRPWPGGGERRRERWRQRDRKRGLGVSVVYSNLNMCKYICINIQIFGFTSKTTGAQKRSILTFSQGPVRSAVWICSCPAHFYVFLFIKFTKNTFAGKNKNIIAYFNLFICFDITLYIIFVFSLNSQNVLVIFFF